MCNDNCTGLVLSKMPVGFSTSDSVKKFADQSFASPVPMATVLGLNSPLPFFFIFKNTDNVDTVYVPKLTTGPLVVTVINAAITTDMQSLPLDDTDAPFLAAINLFGHWPKEHKGTK